jgi:hypothetical protein
VIDVRDPSPSGYYQLLSVWRYGFTAGQDEPLLVSDGTEVYRFQGVLPGQALAVINETGRPTPRHRLELRALSGDRPVTIHESAEDVLVLGWIR